MKIVRGTVENWTSLEEIKKTFQRKEFSDIEEEDNGFTVTICDNEDLGKEFLQVIIIDGDCSKYYKYLEGSSGTAVQYLLLVEGFNNFLFVKEEITTLGKKKFRKFKFSREDVKRSSLEKLNLIEFNNIDSFENLFDTKAVVNEFYDEYKKKRSELIKKIQGIKDEEDKSKYAQVIFDRLIFLHFIQEKGFLCGDRAFLKNKFKEIKEEKKNYYEDFLKFLFFELLNTPNSKRNLKHSEFFEIPFLNGGLFMEHRIEQENPKIWISNDIMEEIIYFLGEWYWFVDEASDFGEEKSLSPEILGHIFEKTITGQKEKGAYYTPEAITNYISENTIFPLCLEKINLEFKTNYSSINEVLNENNPNKIEFLYFEILKKLTILDNAVGSGAFLLAAQKVLIELYKACWISLSKLRKEQIEKENRVISNHKTPDYYFKRYIISNNLFGVDIEEGAIEICKLRLWLSLVSEFDKSTIEPLPNIDYNIMCGNSLLGYIEPPKNEQMTLGSTKGIKEILEDIHNLKIEFSKEEDPKKLKELKKEIDNFLYLENDKLNEKLLSEFKLKKINLNKLRINELNPFHWGLKFSNQFNRDNRGFDIIIGNPPYFSCIKLPKEMIKYLESSLGNLWAARNDVSYYFVLRSLDQLNKGGILSYIMPRYFLKSHYAQDYRNFLRDNTKIVEIIDTENYQIFQGVNILTAIINLKNSLENERNFLKFIRVKEWDKSSKLLMEKIKKGENCGTIETILYPQKELSGEGWGFYCDNEQSLIDSIKEDSKPLSSLSNIGKGMSTGYNEAYVVSSETIKKEHLEKEGIRKLLKNGDIRKYRILKNDEYVIYLQEFKDLKELPNIEKHLKQYRKFLDERKCYNGVWFKYTTPRNADIFNSKIENIVVPFMATENRFSIDSERSIPTSGDVHAINLFPKNHKDIFIYLAILNSKLMEWYHKKTTQLKREGYIEYNKKQLDRFPIKLPKEDLRKEIENRVKKVLLLYNKRDNKELFIKDLLKEIDDRIYQVYNLDSEEIKIIEESFE